MGLQNDRQEHHGFTAQDLLFCILLQTCLIYLFFFLPVAPWRIQFHEAVPQDPDRTCRTSVLQRERTEDALLTRRKKSLWGVWWRAKISLFLRRKDQLWILPSKQTWLSSMLQDKTCYKSSLTGIRGEKIKQLDVNWTCFQVLCLDLTITFLKVPLDLETWFFPLYRSEPRQPSEQPLNMPTPYCLHRWYPGCGKEQTSDSVPSSQELFYMSGNHTPVKLAQALQLGGRNYK